MTEYNTSRNKLIIREYGRNVQQMVEKLLLVEDYQKRTEGAKAVVKAMAQLSPEPKGSRQGSNLDYWHKLWDHLFIISDYRLDVDAPFPKPVRQEKIVEVPENHYRKDKIENRVYGRNMQHVIKTVADYPDSPQKQQLARSIANYLKKLYLIWNRDSVDDQLIFQQLSEMSDGKLVIDDEEFKLTTTRDILIQNQTKKQTGKNSSKRKKRKKNR
ncbi:MAG: DUF4290 domain-containing protein [Bacteroidales bacterium]|nr:DUF4290 domain-containing protein [Bacteroidales bacterium]